MMQRIIYVFCFVLTMISFTTGSYAQKGKSEIALGYGFYSSYQFANHPPYSTSSGTVDVTYRYYVSKWVTLGMNIGYENINNWASFLTFAPELTVKYLDTREDLIRVRLYGSISYGVSILNDNEIGHGYADESGPKPWGLQATPFGIRVGRQFAGFAEVGFGYKGLLHGGVAMRFPRVLARHKHVEETTN